MGKRSRKKTAPQRTGPREEIGMQIKGILLIALAVFCYAGVIYAEQAGELGIFVHNLFRIIAGDTAVVIPLLIGALGLRIMLPESLNIKSRLIGIIILLLLFTIRAHFSLMLEQLDAFTGQDFYRTTLQMGWQKMGGGLVGAAFAALLFFCFKEIGSYIVIAAAALIALLLIMNVTVTQIFKQVARLLTGLVSLLKRFGLYLKEIYIILMSSSEEGGPPGEKKISDTADERRSPAFSGPVVELAGDDQEPAGEWKESQPAVDSYYQKERRLALVEPQENDREPPSQRKKPRLPGLYTPPSLDLLASPGRLGEQKQIKGIRERARLLESTLESFGVKAKVIHVQSGPTVTRFEVQPEAGVKVSRIVNLSDDIALNLAAPLVRIEAPIPGKAALGIEVPNKIIALVYLREVLEDLKFLNSPSPLTVGLGKDITGVPVIADLTKMPHLLIAGATGAGKSVCLNALIISILYKARPERVRFLMIDPKVVELSVYNGIAHLLAPVLTDPKKASLALRNMVREMNRRYEIFAREEVREIAAYNDLIASGRCQGEILPYYVVIIDELADLMLVSPGEVEDSIARLAQMSRAAGIHLVIATQRPSVDVLTGVIKANITSRVAFTVSSQVDSRTILDMSGAEKLLGRGDMLFHPVGAVKPIRVQGAYISEREIKHITDFIKDQGWAEYVVDIDTLDQDKGEELFEPDELFPDALELIVRTGQASISLLQRRFRIGYTRAARLIDDLERRGVVGEYEGSKPREVIITPDQASRLYEEFKKANQ